MDINYLLMGINSAWERWIRQILFDLDRILMFWLSFGVTREDFIEVYGCGLSDYDCSCTFLDPESSSE